MPDRTKMSVDPGGLSVWGMIRVALMTPGSGRKAAVPQIFHSFACQIQQYYFSRERNLRPEP